ncbi:MAG: DUF4249 domain-containing protein [Bacteroidales bacterium]|nr:DUF4249 domain-containing protein [Bacteroidales bacterium]
MKQRTTIIRLALAALAVLTAASCEKVIEIDEADYPPQLVLNGLPSAGQRAFVNFSYTHFFLDPNNAQPVGGAELRLTVGGTTYRPDSVDGCNYFFPYTCQPGDTLRMDIEAAGTSVSAQTYIPPMPAIDGFTAHTFAGGSFRFYRTRFTLHDHGDVPEYYYLTVEVRDSGLRYNPYQHKVDTVDTISHNYFGFRGSGEEITSSDVTPFIPLGGYLYSQLLFTDKRIDGQDYPVELYILNLIDTNEINTETDTFRHWYTIRLESITPARWNYQLSVVRSQSMGSYFAEQARAWSNVSGGVGIFAGMAKQTFTFTPDTLMPFVPPLLKSPARVEEHRAVQPQLSGEEAFYIRPSRW